jgi:hypothetical protein
VSSGVSRRVAAGLLGSALAAPALARNGGLDPANKADALAIYRRMRLCGDQRTFFWWMSGTRYAQVENKLTPMFDIEICSIMRVRETGPDAFTLTQLEMVFNRPVGGGPLLDRWTNPMTGDELTPVYRPVGPVNVPYTVDGSSPPAELPGARIALTRPPKRITINGDDVLLRDDSQAEVTQNDGIGKPYRVNDFAEYHASLRAVQNRREPWVPTTVAFTAVTGWQRWWKMADRPGGSVARAMGRKVARWEEMPAFTRDAVAKLYPTIAADPTRALDLPTFRFER